MAGMAAGAMFSALPEIFKLVQGSQDKSLANKYAQANRPQFRTPDEVFRAYQRLQMLSGQPMPGMGYAQEDIDEGISSGVRGLKELSSPSEANAAAMSLYGSGIDARRKLASEEAGLRREAQGDLANFEVNTLGGYKDKMFEINKFQPYQNAQAAASALFKSGEQNMYGGLTGLSRIGVGLSGMLSAPPEGMGANKTGDVSLDAFFGGGETQQAGANELSFQGSLPMGDSSQSRLRFNHGTPGMPQDGAPYRYQSSPFSWRRPPY